MKIFKYPLVIKDQQKIGLCKKARILSVADQHGVLTLWAIVDEDAKYQYRTINIRGTGHPLDGNEGEFVGTVVMGQFVWHVFDGGE